MHFYIIIFAFVSDPSDGSEEIDVNSPYPKRVIGTNESYDSDMDFEIPETPEYEAANSEKFDDPVIGAQELNAANLNFGSIVGDPISSGKRITVLYVEAIRPSVTDESNETVVTINSAHDPNVLLIMEKSG